MRDGHVEFSDSESSGVSTGAGDSLGPGLSLDSGSSHGADSGGSRGAAAIARYAPGVYRRQCGSGGGPGRHAAPCSLVLDGLPNNKSYHAGSGAVKMVLFAPGSTRHAARARVRAA